MISVTPGRLSLGMLRVPGISPSLHPEPGRFFLGMLRVPGISPSSHPEPGRLSLGMLRVPGIGATRPPISLLPKTSYRSTIASPRNHGRTLRSFFPQKSFPQKSYGSRTDALRAIRCRIGALRSATRSGPKGPRLLIRPCVSPPTLAPWQICWRRRTNWASPRRIGRRCAPYSCPSPKSRGLRLPGQPSIPRGRGASRPYRRWALLAKTSIPFEGPYLFAGQALQVFDDETAYRQRADETARHFQSVPEAQEFSGIPGLTPGPPA